MEVLKAFEKGDADEFKQLRDDGYGSVYFVDDHFLLQPKRIEAFAASSPWSAATPAVAAKAETLPVNVETWLLVPVQLKSMRKIPAGAFAPTQM